MTALIIDTSTDRSLIAISEQKKILISQDQVHGNQLSKNLFPSITRLLNECNILIKNFNYIAAGIGPGSYTGTRMGASVAKGLAFALNIPLIGFCSLQAFLPTRQGSFTILAKTKSEQAYLLKGSRTETMAFDPPCQIPLCDLPGVLENIDHIVSSDTAIFNPEQLAALVYEQFLTRDYKDLDLIYFHTPS
jgi:tRNA threonylcarbamoyl adenosine modification protein YeaZ